MAHKGVEQTVDEMILKLQTGLAAKLTAIEAEEADGIDLDEPTAVTFGIRAEMAFPHVAVLPVRSPQTHDGGGLMLKNHAVRVACWLQHFEEEKLVRSGIRYQRAVAEVLLVNRIPGALPGEAGGYGLQLEEDEYGSPFQDEEIAPGVFIAVFASTFRVQQSQQI